MFLVYITGPFNFNYNYIEIIKINNKLIDIFTLQLKMCITKNSKDSFKLFILLFQSLFSS